jgi:hypothetical protein
VSEDERPQVSWKGILEDAAVLARDGDEAGRVSRIVGDPNADVFSGLAVTPGRRGGERYVDADRITGIWPDTVRTDLDPGELETLPLYEDVPAADWNPPARRSFVDRLLGRGPR